MKNSQQCVIKNVHDLLYEECRAIDDKGYNEDDVNRICTVLVLTVICTHNSSKVSKAI